MAATSPANREWTRARRLLSRARQPWNGGSARGCVGAAASAVFTPTRRTASHPAAMVSRSSRTNRSTLADPPSAAAAGPSALSGRRLATQMAEPPEPTSKTASRTPRVICQVLSKNAFMNRTPLVPRTLMECNGGAKGVVAQEVSLRHEDAWRFRRGPRFRFTDLGAGRGRRSLRLVVVRADRSFDRNAQGPQFVPQAAARDPEPFGGPDLVAAGPLQDPGEELPLHQGQ